MTTRARLLVLILLLAILAVLLARQKVLRETGPEAVAAWINGQEEAGPGLYRVEIGSARLGLTFGTYTAREVTVWPDTAALERLAEAGTPARTRYELTIPRLELTGINRWAMLRGDFETLDIALHAPDLRVWRDRRLRRSGPREATLLPHQRLLAADDAIVVGRLSVHDGRFRYFERSSDGARFALLEIDSLQASAAAITNRGGSTPESGFVPIEMAGRLGRKARLHTTMMYDTRTPAFNLVVNGGLGPADAGLLNPLLTDLEGARITAGTVDSIAWDFTVTDGLAEGRMLAIYRDLTMERLDKVSRTQDLGDAIASFLANLLKLKQANPASAGDPPRVVALAHRRAPHEAFFRFLWVTLRGGLLETVGL